jgi:hypothetical protein
MKAGDRIRVQIYMMGVACHLEDYTVEEFRYCLGIFTSDERRRAGLFTPLCELYEPGPESEDDYIPNFGSYMTKQVQSWMDIP